MAKVPFLNLSPAEREMFWRGLQPGDRFTYSNIRVKSVLLSRYKIKNLSQRSLLPQIAADWGLLNTSQKTAWHDAGQQCGLSAYRLYVKDKCARIKNGLTGDATPSLLHQVWAGQIHIESPATQIKIVQLHPRNYYVHKKITGTKAQYSPILITEDIALPFVLGCNYKSNLTTAGPNPSAKLYAKFWYKYQAVDLFFDLVCDLDFVADWKTVTATVSDLKTILVGYDLYIELVDLQGDIYFDKIKAEHSGQNWCRDTYMQDMNASFTKQFYQIPKHWAPLIMPNGATYDSVYPT
jgi:hypothetical protein